MANATDFIASVYDTLATTFNMGAAPANLFLQMAWPGIPISSADYKDASGQYNSNLAEEIFSSLANMAPVLNKAKFENSAFNIDDIYDIIISSARPNGVPDADLAVNPMFRLFADAQYEFVRSTKGSSRDPNETYHRSIATPSNWYDEAAASFWTSINIQSSQIKPADPNSAFVKYKGYKLLDGGLMKLKGGAQALSTPINTKLIQANSRNKLVLENRFKTSSFVATPGILHSNSELVFKTMKTPAAAKPSVMLNNSFKNDLVASNLNNAIKRPLPINTFAKNTSVLNNVKIQDINTDRLLVKPKIYSPKNAIFLNDLLIKDLPTQQSVGTDGFSISFKFCRVNIDRPWLNLALLSTQNWNIYGANVGEYSNGLPENNPGIFPLLPTSFILISNVHITANWSAQDKANLANAVSFGPFDLRNGTFNQNALDIKGIQIIGCLSKVTPVLAPKASPVI
ncbi:MAG: hypothetical protein NT040_12040 [Bacteroidetes bacterium]|nr:hypothetical protein [Bacteroidota bacterium]